MDPGIHGISINSAQGVMTIIVAASRFISEIEIEYCCRQVGSAIAHVEGCATTAALGFLVWELSAQLRCCHFILRRPFYQSGYPDAVAEELEAIIAGETEEMLH